MWVKGHEMQTWRRLDDYLILRIRKLTGGTAAAWEKGHETQTETNGRPCCRVGERPRNADPVLRLDSVGSEIIRLDVYEGKYLRCAMDF